VLLFQAAQLALQEMLRLEPFRVKGTEILSTTLWHLNREKQLCALAQQVAEIDKMSPETWCVVGNCFSLQKEHDTALKFFSRSIQMDPTFTYAHYIHSPDMNISVTKIWIKHRHHSGMPYFTTRDIIMRGMG
jgi:lipoprotein NlpI